MGEPKTNSCRPHPKLGRRQASEPAAAVERSCPLAATLFGSPGGWQGLENQVGGGTRLDSSHLMETGVTEIPGDGPVALLEASKIFKHR